MSPGSSLHHILLLPSGDEGWIRGSVAASAGTSTRIQSAPQCLLPGCFSAGKQIVAGTRGLNCRLWPLGSSLHPFWISAMSNGAKRKLNTDALSRYETAIPSSYLRLRGWFHTYSLKLTWCDPSNRHRMIVSDADHSSDYCFLTQHCIPRHGFHE